MIRKLALMALAALTVAAFVWAAGRQGALNTDMVAIDQYSYMEYARGMAETRLQFVGDRNRMPLYPGLMSFFYDPALSDEAFFERGKQVGIAIALVVLGVAYLLFRRVADRLDALAATLVAMFTVFAYKAPYFQTEVLFYGVSFLLFYLLLSLVQRPRFRTAAFAGAVAGVAHLTKASVLPALLLAGLIVVARGLLELRQARPAYALALISRPAPSPILTHIGYVAVLAGCFLLVVFPYIRTSKERFGHYFYNVNSTFYIWYDSWDEVNAGTKAHGDRVGWPTMPEDEIPSLQKYLREHSPAQIVGRVVGGLKTLRQNALGSYGYVEFLFVYGLALALLVAQNVGSWRALLARRAHLAALLFTLGYFLGYTLLYAWYTPIASGNRFILALLLPALFVVVYALQHAQREGLAFTMLGRRVPAAMVSPAVLLFLVAYVLNVLPYRVSTMFGGL